MTINTINDRNLNTGSEIEAQPGTWKLVYELLLSKKTAIRDFLTPILTKQNLRIVLSGAGSSAFLGEAAQILIERKTGKITQAIPSTDIVTHPEPLFASQTPILMVSFARSGNSPESLESIKLADQYCGELYHLIITCNKDGQLASYTQSKDNCFCLVLPEETHDQSLAMTNSFTSMLLSILLISDIDNLEKNTEQVEKIIDLGGDIIKYSDVFEDLASKDYERVVFLGSGEMLGIARECSLKLQELTDGYVICKHDSFLGFRHGPRAVVNDKTLMVYLFSTNAHTIQYEKDLALDIATDTRKIQSLSVGRLQDLDIQNTIKVQLSLEKDNWFQIVPITLVGQLLAYYKSLYLGLDPDNPSVSGAISRVVKGVKIYKAPRP